MSYIATQVVISTLMQMVIFQKKSNGKSSKSYSNQKENIYQHDLLQTWQYFFQNIIKNNNRTEKTRIRTENQKHIYVQKLLAKLSFGEVQPYRWVLTTTVNDETRVIDDVTSGCYV